ncbi:MAG: hypothetical protein JWQ38_792 [Flavipsychrobacter sp.]|nr:hypothetical protein [Flavipsychrobacter sp.]
MHNNNLQQYYNGKGRVYLLVAMVLCLLAAEPAQARQQEVSRMLDRAMVLIDSGVAEQGLPLADSALKLAKQQDDHQLIIQGMSTKGKALLYVSRNKEAVDLYFEALALCKPPSDNRLIANLYKEIGYTYFRQAHYREAKSYYQKELALRRVVMGNDSVGACLINIAVMHQDLKEFDSARIVFNEVAAILARKDQVKLRGFYYLNRGSMLELTGNLDSATYYYQCAHDVWKSLGNQSEIYKATFNLGYIAEEKKDYLQALKYYHLSEEAARKYGLQKDIAHVYGTMAEAYAAINDYKNGYLNLYKYVELTDSLSKSEFNSYVVKLDKQFQAEKNKEIIQAQQLKIETDNVAIQKGRNTTLLIIIILIAVLLISVVAFVYFTFQKRVQKEVEAAKEKFFANVVHEIRTPLSMIQGPIKVLQSKVTDPELHYQLDMAERNTERLGALINQMLDISKIEADKYALKESVGNISAFMVDVTGQYLPQAQEKGLNLSQQIEATSGNVYFDKDAIEKITGNLLGNAIKYTPSGGTIGIETAIARDAGNLKMTITVWDTGAGISKEEQPKIFSRFFRAREQEGIKGTGIGLSLVKDLVTLMHGTIDVDSDPGKGSVFTVVLTLRQAEQVVAGSDELAGDVVLLVEDDSDILDFNKTLLAEKGYQVLTARNGDEALVIIKEQLPDLVVTDLMMPGKDGLALIKDLRVNPLTGHIPVIILSAKASGQAKVDGAECGAQVYLSKPFQPDELVALVKNQLQVLEQQRAYYQQQSKKEDAPVADRFAGTDPFTQKCYDVINKHLDDTQLSVGKLAELMNINRSHFQRKIKALTGYSPSELIRNIRLEKAREMLLKKEGNITEIAYSTGFTSQSYFTKCFSDHFGYPPSHEVNGK